jgi:hypothetical protein
MGHGGEAPIIIMCSLHITANELLHVIIKLRMYTYFKHYIMHIRKLQSTQKSTLKEINS